MFFGKQKIEMYPGWLLVKEDKKILVTIVGDSMSPTLLDGDKVYFELKPLKKIRINDIVLVKHPYIKQRNLVKRIKNIYSDGSVFIQGDNSFSSTDSKSFGTVNKNNILGILKERIRYNE